MGEGGATARCECRREVDRGANPENAGVGSSLSCCIAWTGGCGECVAEGLGARGRGLVVGAR